MSYPLNNNNLVQDEPQIRYVGEVGPMGPQGPQGVQGRDGATGPMGPMGPTGPKGDRGDVGPKGDRGPRGEQGPQGERGNDGFNGLRGPRGYEGPRGPKGADGTVVFDELTEEQRASLVGPMGPRGYTGAKGDKGERGPQGLEGPKGPKGDKGETGANGPQGPKGNTGDQGPQGPPGPIGEQGPSGRDGMTHSDHIGVGNTWNSKMIADYVTHGRVSWDYKEGLQLGEKDTVSGYIKDIVVRGKTLTNYVVKAPFNGAITSSRNIEVAYSKQSTIPQERLVYLMPGGGEAFRLEPQKDYTLIYKMTVKTEGYVLDDLVERVQLTVKDASGVTTYGAGLKDGIVKVSFRTGQTEPINIGIDLFSTSEPEGQGENVSFVASDFMIVDGDWTNKVAPRYFTGKKGVGDKRKDVVPAEYEINIESRNKNLLNKAEIISDYYIAKDEEQGDHAEYRWKKGLKGDNVSFLVYCKQATYTLAIKGKKDKKTHLRYKVLGYADTPTNGEPGTLIAEFTDFDIAQGTGYLAKSFKISSSNINVLAIYIANLKYTPQEPHSPSHMEWDYNDVIEYAQLEEGDVATNYEPYRSITKALRVPRQLMDGEWLEWEPSAGVYAIHTPAGPGHESHLELTKIKEEAFINSYKDMTYAYIRTKIPTVFGGKFPIEIGETYKKNEWGFEGDNILQGNNNLKNFLKLPNGLFMQWRTITLPSGEQAQDEVFLMAKSIIHVQATPIYTERADSRTGTVVVRIKNHNTVQVLGGGQVKHAMVLVISDNSIEDV